MEPAYIAAIAVGAIIVLYLFIFKILGLRVVGSDEVAVIEKIPFGHKFALTDLNKNQAVLKYGEEIGKMKIELKKGGWIHNHNMYCDRGIK
jgi:altronate dehydratase